MNTSTRLSLLLLLVISCVIESTANADVVLSTTGVSGKGVPVAFRATFSISGDDLDVIIENVSTSPILNPDDVIGSIYFDIVDASNNRPTLANYSATGDVYLTDASGPDVLQEAGADLTAVNSGDNTWQFKPMDPFANPLLGFGVGTVGNNGLTPNNFNGNIVGAIDYSIFTGDITTNNLRNKLLVKDEIRFSFTGVTGFTENDITRRVAFGLGTAPDSMLIAVPEPGTICAISLVGIASTLRRRRRN